MSGNDARRQLALDVVLRLRQHGHVALWAGGCVRDLLMGHEPSDYDVATSATPEQVMDAFPRTVPVGISFGVVRVLGPKEAGEVEVATFRSDDAYVDGRRPVSVTYGTPELDAARRDFTINGMFFDPQENAVIDHVGGRQDLENQIIRAIGDPEARFTEDKLRLLRAVRFAARFGFLLEPSTRDALERMAEQVHIVAPERICQELHKMLVHQSRATGLQLMRDTGLLAHIMPELAALRGQPVEPSCADNGDLLDHAIEVLSLLPEKPTFPTALAALLHDAGLPMEREARLRDVDASHPALGARIADDLCRDLKTSNQERERASWLVASHHALDGAHALPHAVLKRLLAHPGYPELESLVHADQMAHSGTTPDTDFCQLYLRDLPAGPIDPPPLLGGHDLLAQGLKPGPHFSSFLEQVRVAQLNQEVKTRADALELLERISRQHQKAEPH